MCTVLQNLLLETPSVNEDEPTVENTVILSNSVLHVIKPSRRGRPCWTKTTWFSFFFCFFFFFFFWGVGGEGGRDKGLGEGSTAGSTWGCSIQVRSSAETDWKLDHKLADTLHTLPESTVSNRVLQTQSFYTSGDFRVSPTRAAMIYTSLRYSRKLPMDGRSKERSVTTGWAKSVFTGAPWVV